MLSSNDWATTRQLQPLALEWARYYPRVLSEIMVSIIMEVKEDFIVKVLDCGCLMRNWCTSCVVMTAVSRAWSLQEKGELRIEELNHQA